MCSSTDNPWSLEAWGQAHKAAGKAGLHTPASRMLHAQPWFTLLSFVQVRMLADPQGKLAKALGVEVDAPPLGLASKRYSAVIKDNTFKSFNLEADGFGLTCSLATVIVDQLKEA